MLLVSQVKSNHNRCGSRLDCGSEIFQEYALKYDLSIKVCINNPNVAKVGGLQSQGVKGEVVVGYLDPLTTQDLKSSGFPVG